MEDNLTTKTCLTKNLAKQNFNTVLTLSVDANANIKTVLDVEGFLIDSRIDAGSGKATLTGKVGVKVLYIDTDNITNTLTDSQSITETITDSSITTDAYLNATNTNVVCNVLSSDGGLKISCEVSFNPIVYMNMPLPTTATNFENLIVKKSEISTCSISSVVDNNFNYSVNMETKDDIAKILMCNAHFTPESVQAEQGKAVVEGKLYCTLVYESAGEESELKQLTDTFSLKSALEINTEEGDSLDLTFTLDPFKTNITHEKEDDGTIITIQHNITTKGVCLKSVTLDIVDDMYSTENELEIANSTREYCYAVDCTRINENISGEVSIEESETAIEKIVSNLNTRAEITNSYIKDGNLTVEGIISSCVVYLDENKEYKQKPTELPFIINTKIKLEKIDCIHISAEIEDARTKSKRGTIIELDYSIKLTICLFEKCSRELLSNFTLGKPLNFGDYDYQIFLAKAGESMWELCKRIKISPDDIGKYNPNLPLVMEGGEKVIIKR